MTKKCTRRGFTQQLQTGRDLLSSSPLVGEVARRVEGGLSNKKHFFNTLLPRLTAVLPPQGREMLHGFTLIELLVVVLIIGILAAVAVPQYQKAVEKARLSEALQNISAIEKCLALYRLEYGLPENTIFLKDMNCPIEPTLGTWYDEANDENGDYEEYWGSYKSKYFKYQAYCNINRCVLEVHHIPDDYGLTQLLGTTRKCYTQDTDLGRYICKSIENQGWEYRDDEF